jgi:NhaP-type Na+/H+ or K+/H+ antiporter
MNNRAVGLAKFFVLWVWTVLGFCAGGFASGEIYAWSVSDVTKRMPPPRDATFPIILIFTLVGAVLGAIAAHVSGYLFLVKFYPASEAD